MGPWAAAGQPLTGSPPPLVVRQGIPANGRPCMACYGTGRIMIVASPFDGTTPWMRSTVVDGRPWPEPDLNSECSHCGGTGVMGPNGEPTNVSAFAPPRPDDDAGKR